MDLQISVVSYGACAAAFVFLTGLISLGGGWSLHKRFVVMSSAITAVWAATVVFAERSGVDWVAVITELLRDGTWLIFLAMLLSAGGAVSHLRLALMAVFGVAGAGLILIGAVFGQEAAPDVPGAMPALVGIGHVLLAVLGLQLVETLFRNADEKGRWALKHLFFGLGALFAYDFFYYADAALFRRIDMALYEARGFVNILAVPLIAVSVSRYREWEVDVHVSRRVVFHSAALLASGLYLLAMAAAGFYIRNFGGDWGVIFQIIFLTGAGMMLVVIFSSRSFRAKIKVWISKHFFSYKYDYREEWLKFTRATVGDDGAAGLHERIVRAIADIIDSNAGALWVLREEDRSYIPTATWNLLGDLPGDRLPAESTDSEFVAFLRRTHWIIDFDEFKIDPLRYEGLVVPDWLMRHPRASLIMPLVHHDTLQAFLVLGESRIRRELDWEDHDLLKTVGSQAASYLAEERAANALSDARRLEDFNRRSAFVVHDIKNLVGQMSLMLKNAEKFGDRPEFQKDMLATVRNSVSRMTDLLQQFKAARETPPKANGAVPLDALVGRAADAWKRQTDHLTVDLAVDDVWVAGNEKALATVLDHLIQNAVDAAGDAGTVALRVKVLDKEAVVEVVDDGPGMDEDFVRDQLFRPLDSGKDTGFGLGAYQTRQMVRDMGGRLEVETAPGAGTTMRIVLPLVQREAGTDMAD